VGAIAIVVVIIAILAAAWAQNVQEPEDHGDYYMDTPQYCGVGRC
jgi:hypothetical protein